MLNVNEEYKVLIIDYGIEGMGIAKINNITVFIPYALKDEEVKVKITDTAKNYAFGEIIEIIKPSATRIKEDCVYFYDCGGCLLRHTNYENTLAIKKTTTINTIKRILKKELSISDIIGMDNPFNYRNKVHYRFGYNKKNEFIIGNYKRKTNELVHIDNCKIEDETCNNIAKDLYNYIKDLNTNKDVLKGIILRISKSSGDVMLIVISNERNISKEKDIINYITNKYTCIKTIIKNINTTRNVLGDKNIVIYGDGYITDKLNDYTFKISPNSFFQVNNTQTEKLYNKAIELAELKENDIVFDMYSGIGTISICVSKYVKSVYGVEIVKDAYKDALENLKLNNIKNVEFTLGDAKTLLDNKIKPSVVILDPPRGGCDESVINKLLEVDSKKIVYISCSPKTLSRDLLLLESKYDIKSINLVDMFCYSDNVECIALLSLKTL